MSKVVGLVANPRRHGVPARMWALGSVGLLLVAGCLQAGTEASTLAGDQGLELGLGDAAIRGMVTDEELRPVQGAWVQVDDHPATLTNEAGMFSVRGLRAGTHLIDVRSEGFEFDVHTVSLEPGQTRLVEIVLQRLASTEPYVEVIFKRGYSFCDYVYLINAAKLQPCASLLDGGQDDQYITVAVPPSWRFIVTEVTWDPNLAQGQDSMRVAHAPGPSCSGGNGVQDRNANTTCYGVYMAPRYVKLEGHPGPKTEIGLYYDTWEDYRNQPYPDGPFDLYVLPQWTGWAQPAAALRCDPVRSAAWQQGAGSKYCYGVGISTGVPINTWVSIFHWAKPLQPNACCPTTDYSAVEDQ